MKVETQTRCSEKHDGIICHGAVVRDERISRMERSMSHRKYTCIKCGTSWKIRNT